MRLIKELKIEKLVYKGYGLAYHDDKTIFVQHAYPGDVVDAKVIFEKGKIRFAEVETILSPSNRRIKSQCEAFGKCGGCDWLTLQYEHQLEAKQIIIDEIFSHLASRTDFISSSKDIHHYRNKTFMPLTESGGDIKIGMFAKQSHQVIPHKTCRLHPEIFDKIAEDFVRYCYAAKVPIYDEQKHTGAVRHLGFRMNTAGEIIMVVVTKTRKMPFTKQLVRMINEKYENVIGIVQNINPKPGNTILDDDEKILMGKPDFTEIIDDVKYKLNYKSFFQINAGVAADLYAYIKEQIAPQKTVLDAYCGVGAIGIYTADKAEKIIGIEQNEQALQDARISAELNGLNNTEFLSGDVEAEIEKVLSSQPIDTIIFDPPRKGLSSKLIDLIAKYNVPHLIYVSCNPMSQFRDCQILIENGYQVTKRKAFDMFPHTYHIENVVIMDRA